ncbi:Hypothetical predicted protein [Pelobates cultripes]|uniref:Uncharacterized protein n=1 Tax=Pelobates cultripes TaxID=61616 RepID=A0AAD1SJL0_PELCU|nr:Hypothetical predicted protein [Pelobates cultripes]
MRSQKGRAAEEERKVCHWGTRLSQGVTWSALQCLVRAAGRGLSRRVRMRRAAAASSVLAGRRCQGIAERGRRAVRTCCHLAPGLQTDRQTGGSAHPPISTLHSTARGTAPTDRLKRSILFNISQ